MRAVMKMLSSLLLALALANTAQAECNLHSLRLAVIPKKSMEALQQDYQPLLQHLQQKLGMPVEMVSVSSYESVIDALVSGGVDLAWLGPASYVLAHQRDPRIEPFASLTIAQGYFTPAGHHYQSLLLVRREGAAKLGALKGARVALSDPASTSGSVVPNAEFPAQVGMPLGQFFGSVSYSGSHDKSLDALLDGKVDAAFVASVRADAYLKSGRIDRNSLRVLWRSERIYYDPYVFSGNLCPALKTRIRKAMLDDQNQLDAFLASQQASAIVPASHAQYAPLLQKMQAAGLGP